MFFIIIFIILLVTINRQINLINNKFIDKQNRQRVFHGINVVHKKFPYYDQIIFNETDFQTMQKFGLNVIRLGVKWQGVQTQTGWNQTYLSIMENIINIAGKYGIYTMIQFHQDLLSSRFCANGIPNWLIKNKESFGFPFPLDFPYKIDEKKNVPIGCQRHPWGLYYFSYAVQKTFHDLYKNGNGLRDRFIRYYQKMVQKYKNNPYVISYELINQPFAGNIYRNPLLLIPAVAQRINLQPFYDILHSEIRKIDPQTPLCFQPVTWDNEMPTGFSHPPGGKIYANSSILCYHLYHPPVFNCTAALLARVRDAKKLNISSMLSEFVHFTPNVDQVLDAAQEHFQTWMIWDYVIGSSPEKNDVLQVACRTYSIAIAGQRIQQKFNHETSQFISVYYACSQCGESVIYINQHKHYSTGYIINLQPKELSYKIMDGYMSVTVPNELDGRMVSIVIKKKYK